MPRRKATPKRKSSSKQAPRPGEKKLKPRFGEQLHLLEQVFVLVLAFDPDTWG